LFHHQGTFFSVELTLVKIQDEKSITSAMTWRIC
jgi:hypothetical protein